MTRRASTKIIIQAMHILADQIRSEDGIASGAALEAADRLEELEARVGRLKARLAKRGKPNAEITGRPKA